MKVPTTPYPPDFGNKLVDDFGTIPASTPEQVGAARRYVAANAVDADDARGLLAMLGLLGDA